MDYEARITELERRVEEQEGQITELFQLCSDQIQHTIFLQKAANENEKRYIDLVDVITKIARL